MTRYVTPAALLFLALTASALPAQSFARISADRERILRHQDPEWLLIAPHLADPTSASAESLQLQGDVLRARRFEEDAIDYYSYALKRGGDEATLDGRIGVIQLVLNQPALARATFKRVVTLRPKDGKGWNNLAAAEFAERDYHACIFHYQRAVKLDKRDAIYHSNLGIAYFEVKDFEAGRKEFQKAFRLDPTVFRSGGSGGIQAHILSSSQPGLFYFELARIAARDHDSTAVLTWLTKASEAGYNIAGEMSPVSELKPWRHDPAVELIIRNGRNLRSGKVAQLDPLPALPAETPTPH